MVATDSSALRASLIAGAASLSRRVAASLTHALLAERRRWILWLPVVEGCGIGGYFTRAAEPSWWPGLLSLAAGVVVWLMLRRRIAVLPRALAAGALLLAIVSAGWVDAQWQTRRSAGPLLNEATPPLRFQGVVGDIAILPQGCRIELTAPVIEALSPAETPARIRLRTRICPAAIGETVRGRALLFPIPAPMFPGGYDFQRQSYFQGIGGTGFTLGGLYDIADAPAARPDRLLALRHVMTARIMAALPGAEGGVAAALITGEKAGIPPLVAQDFRDSGLAHMLVIAGLHMSLVAGFVFFAARALLALIPAIALRYPIRKIAAVASLAAALAYLAVSGGAIPTERAFMMCCLGILAILFDRAVFSMRGLALAALVVLTIDPVALMGVSFQMSFAAVVALIAFYESTPAWLAGLHVGAGPLRRMGLHLFGIAMTTVIATIGTIPFTVYHFGRFALYSVLANLVAVPLAGIWMLPWAFIACLLMPLHLEALALVPMGWGIRVVEVVAHWTANLPQDVMILPSMPDLALLAISAGGLWLCLWQGRWRFWGVLPILAGLSTIPLIQPPDLFVAADSRLVALRGDDGRLYLSSSRRERMTAESWETAAGVRQTAALPEDGVVRSHGGDWACDGDGCRWRAGARSITILRHVPEDGDACPDGGLVIALRPLPDRCHVGHDILDPTTIRNAGAQTIWLRDPLLIRRAAAERGERPWIPVSNAASGQRDGPAP